MCRVLQIVYGLVLENISQGKIVLRGDKRSKPKEWPAETKSPETNREFSWVLNEFMKLPKIREDAVLELFE